ncbi:MAG: HD-GYP domain-containing protein [Gaiellales bacterium]
MRIARGGLAQSLTADELGGGIGIAWRSMLRSVGGSELSVHALVVDDQTLGAITVVPSGSHDEIQLEAITIFAQQVAALLEKADLHRAAQDAASSMRIQNRVLADLADERDVESLRSAIERLVHDELMAATVAILPIDSTGRLTVPVRAEDTFTTIRVASAAELDRVAPVLAATAPMIIKQPGSCCQDALGDSGGSGDPGHTATTWGMRLHAGERTTGVLLVAVPDQLHEGREQQVSELLRVLSPAVSVALDNAQLFAREYVRGSRLSAANTLARTVTGSSSRDDLFDTLASGVAAIYGYGRVAVYAPDLHQLAAVGAAPRRVEDRERALVSTAMHRRRSSRTERPDSTGIAVPVMSGDRIHAVLHVQQPAAITPEQESDDLALLRSVCEHAAACLVAITASDQIERNYMDTIQALVHALEARDQYTADHSDVVAEWALETGRRLGMGDDDLRDLELGAILHDIGKVAIPDSILNKNGRLTDEEFEVMKSHTVTGERILKPIGFLAKVAPIVRHEHERWDGRGYPDGISGTDIPLASRIIFVCDAYHAITSDRPYREGQSHAFAHKVITENAGTQFDPAVVSVFIEVIGQWCDEHHIADPLGAGDTGVEIVNPLGSIGEVESDGEGAAAAA